MELNSFTCRIVILYPYVECNGGATLFIDETNKNNSRASLNEKTLNSLIQICVEGPTLEEFDPLPAVKLWSEAVNARRPNQSKRKQHKQSVKKSSENPDRRIGIK